MTALKIVKMLEHHSHHVFLIVDVFMLNIPIPIPPRQQQHKPKTLTVPEKKIRKEEEPA